MVIVEKNKTIVMCRNLCGSNILKFILNIKNIKNILVAYKLYNLCRVIQNWRRPY